MPGLCCPRRPCIRFPILCIATFQLIAYLAVLIVHPSFHSPTERFEKTSERIEILRAGTSSGKQSLTREPTHLSLGTTLYRIKDRLGEGKGEGLCLGRRKRVEKTHDHFEQSVRCQGPAAEPPLSAHDQNVAGKLIYGNRGLPVDARAEKTIAMEETSDLYNGLPPYIIRYLAPTGSSPNGLHRDPNHQIPESHPVKKIIYDKMCDYLTSRKKHMVLVNENKNTSRQRSIMEANDHLGCREITDLVLQEKEVDFAKDLLSMKDLGSLSSWSHNGFCSAIVDVLRSVRVVLYRIRILDDMCHPPLFDDFDARKESQMEAFELLKDFWTKHVFRAIADKRKRRKLLEAKPGSLEELFGVALMNISKRSGQVPAMKTSLSWYVFKYWCKTKLSMRSPDLYKKLREFVIKDKKWLEDIHPAFKTYLADQAVAEACKARMIDSDYQIISKAQFKLKIEI